MTTGGHGREGLGRGAMNRSDHLERTNLSTRACSLAPRERLQARSLRERKLLRSADLIVGLGYDTIEVEYEAWIDDRPLLQIDIEPADVAPTVKLVHQVTGDLASSLARPADQVRAGRQPQKALGLTIPESFLLRA